MNDIKLSNTVLLFLALMPDVQERKRVDYRNGITFEIRTKEQGHNVPHCHASCGNKNISISLIDYSVLAGNLSKKQEDFAIEFVKENSENFKQYWNKYHKITI